MKVEVAGRRYDLRKYNWDETEYEGPNDFLDQMEKHLPPGDRPTLKKGR